MPKSTLPHVKRVTSKGHLYHYFDTGQKKDGRPILLRLPDPADKAGYGVAYAAALSGRARRSARAELLTVPVFVDQFLSSEYLATKAASTRDAYRMALTRFKQLLPSAPAGEVRPDHIVKLMDKLADKPGAANALLGGVSALYKWGRRRRLVTNEPARGVEQLPMGEHQPWPDDLLAAALAAEDAEVRLAVHLLYFTAQRIGDVIRMRWSDVRDGRIHVVQQKTGRPLEVPIHEQLAEELARAPKKGLTILAGPRSAPRKAATIRDKLQAFAIARQQKIVPHGLRKNAVIALLEAGCSTAEAAAISGQSLQMVEHYAKLRSQRVLADAAIHKWNGRRTGKQIGKPA